MTKLEELKAAHAAAYYAARDAYTTYDAARDAYEAASYAADAAEDAYQTELNKLTDKDNSKHE